ncbi:MAG: polyprenyl synthetase family protein [Chromatiales bacterium]|nr:polyprenyl synthetase family protein [Chromatiales bacterium]
MSFAQRVPEYRARADQSLARWLPAAEVAPTRLHEALRYSVLGAGKRIRPLLSYATGEILGLEPSRCDAPAVAVELIHAYSLVHDDLPAMDDDDLRRGRPTTHVAYDEATALLVGDALQSLAFQILAEDEACLAGPALRMRMLAELAVASGSRGMVGGQALDLRAEGRALDQAEIERIYRLKTGRLIEAAIMLPVILAGELPLSGERALRAFATQIGLAFQIRDDLLDVEGETSVIGKPGGSDERNRKATLPAVVGLEATRLRADTVYADAISALDPLGDRAEPLRWLSEFIIRRDH